MTKTEQRVERFKCAVRVLLVLFATGAEIPAFAADQCRDIFGSDRSLVLSSAREIERVSRELIVRRETLPAINELPSGVVQLSPDELRDVARRAEEIHRQMRNKAKEDIEGAVDIGAFDVLETAIEPGRASALRFMERQQTAYFDYAAQEKHVNALYRRFAKVFSALAERTSPNTSAARRALLALRYRTLSGHAAAAKKAYDRLLSAAIELKSQAARAQSQLPQLRQIRRTLSVEMAVAYAVLDRIQRDDLESPQEIQANRALRSQIQLRLQTFRLGLIENVSTSLSNLSMLETRISNTLSLLDSIRLIPSQQRLVQTLLLANGNLTDIRLPTELESAVAPRMIQMRQGNVFDADYYRKTYGLEHMDAEAARQHFFGIGLSQGWIGDASFSTEEFKEIYYKPDDGDSPPWHFYGSQPAHHYYQNMFWKYPAGRFALHNLVFDAEYYRGRYPDLTYMSELELRRHYAQYGIFEGRVAHPTFSAQDYLDLNPDVASAVGNSLMAGVRHYVLEGRKQNRQTIKPQP